MDYNKRINNPAKKSRRNYNSYSGRLTRSMTGAGSIKNTRLTRQTRRSMTRKVHTRKARSDHHGAEHQSVVVFVAEPTITEGVYVREASHDQTGGSGASSPDIQQRVGEMLGLFKIVPVPTNSILNEEQATLIATSWQHDSILECNRDKPVTSREKTRLLNDKANDPVMECQCKVHISLPTLEPSFAFSLKSIISSAAELDGDMKGGNLTNCGVELLKLIFNFGGKMNMIMVCPEATSSAADGSRGSKVVYEIGVGEETICVEATPDFYARTFEYVYLLIGECESSGSRYPSVQLAIATLGQFASKRFKHPAKKLAACLFTKDKTASVFLGEELERRDEKIFVSFSKVNRERAFTLTSENDVADFADTMIGIIEKVSN